MQRVVADVAAQADLDVVLGASAVRQDVAHLPTEVALHLEDQATNLAVRIVGAPPQELLGEGVQRGGRRPGAQGTQHHHTRVQPALRHG